MRIVDCSKEKIDFDSNDFCYAVCSCLPLRFSIEIPRPDHSEYIRFTCPKCGSSLGIIAIGKEEKKNGEFLGVL